jgi:hypothetical protein
MREIATGVYLKRIQEFDAKGISYTDYLRQCGIGVVNPTTKMDAAVQMGDGKLWLQETIRRNTGTNPSFGPNGNFDFMSELNKGVQNGWVTQADLDFYNINMAGKGVMAAQQYTPKQAASLFNYTKCGGFEINAYLNDGMLDGPHGPIKARAAYNGIGDIQDSISGYHGNRVFPSTQGNIVDRLDSAIRHTNYDSAIVSYRGTGHVYNNGVQVDPFSLKPGDELRTSAGFSSSSLLPSNTYKKECILEIVTPPKSGLGAYIEPYAGVSGYGQMEVLLKRGGGMVVAGNAYQADFFGDGVLRTIIPVIMTE